MDITVTKAAEKLRVSSIWARKLCHRYNIGRLINPRLRLLSESDIPRLRKAIAEAPKNRGRKFPDTDA